MYLKLKWPLQKETREDLPPHLPHLKCEYHLLQRGYSLTFFYESYLLTQWQTSAKIKMWSWVFGTSKIIGRERIRSISLCEIEEKKMMNLFFNTVFRKYLLSHFGHKCSSYKNYCHTIFLNHRIHRYNPYIKMFYILSYIKMYPEFFEFVQRCCISWTLNPQIFLWSYSVHTWKFSLSFEAWYIGQASPLPHLSAKNSVIPHLWFDSIQSFLSGTVDNKE